jgi:hypothetical protein
MQEKTVAIRTCNDVMEANLIKAQLESYGIECFITNSNFSTLMPVFNNMWGGMVKVYVMESNEKLAGELLEGNETKTNQVACPECHSVNVKYGFGKNRILKIFSVILSVLATVPPGTNLYTYHCKDCGTEFKLK